MKTLTSFWTSPGGNSEFSEQTRNDAVRCLPWQSQFPIKKIKYFIFKFCLYWAWCDRSMDPCFPLFSLNLWQRLPLGNRTLQRWEEPIMIGRISLYRALPWILYKHPLQGYRFPIRVLGCFRVWFLSVLDGCLVPS